MEEQRRLSRSFLSTSIRDKDRSVVFCSIHWTSLSVCRSNLGSHRSVLSSEMEILLIYSVLSLCRRACSFKHLLRLSQHDQQQCVASMPADTWSMPFVLDDGISYPLSVSSSHNLSPVVVDHVDSEYLCYSSVVYSIYLSVTISFACLSVDACCSTHPTDLRWFRDRSTRRVKTPRHRWVSSFYP